MLQTEPYRPRNDRNRVRASDFGGEQPKIVVWTPFEVFCIKNDGRFSGRGELDDANA